MHPCSSRLYLLVIVGVVFASLLLSATPALATTPGGRGQQGPSIDDKREEARRIQAEIDARAERIAALDQSYGRTRVALGDTQARLEGTRAQLASADVRFVGAKARLARYAVDAYVHDGSRTFLRQLPLLGTGESTIRREYLNLAAGDERQAMSELNAARQDLRGLQASLARAQQSTQAAMKKLRSDRDALSRAEAAQQAELTHVQGEVARLVAEEQARANEEAERRALAALSARAARPATRPSADEDKTATVTPGAPEVPSLSRSRTRGTATIAGEGSGGGGSGRPGGVWECIRQLESGGDYGSPGGGAYQFLDSTWHSLGQAGTASNAPPALQDAMALALQRRSGWSQWTTARRCGVG